MSATGQTAPAGYHYMSDGSLMSDADHTKLYGKKIKSFNLDFNDIKAAGESRTFTISGDNDAIFSLEIKNEDNYYYNFQTNLFQVTKTRLSDVSITNGVYVNSVVFPLVTDADQYNFFLFTGQGTKHEDYSEVRLADNTVDINSSTGSNSNILQKVIYQTLDVTITINGYSPNGTVTGANTTSATIVTSRDKSIGKIPFSHVFTVTSTRTLSIKTQPSVSDIMVYSARTIGSAPLTIPREDIYPAVTAADKVVNGAVSSGTNVTMDDDFTGLWAVGDKITGNAAFDARTQSTAVTVTAVNVGSNAKVFTMSEAIAIDDDETLSFSNQRNYRWPLNDIHKLQAGMTTIASTFFAVPPNIKDYINPQTTVFEDEANEYTIAGTTIPALDTLGAKPSITRNATTNVSRTIQTGNIIFNKQSLLTLAGETINIYGYGVRGIKNLTDYDVEFGDLAVALKEVTTTTTAAVNSSTSVVVANRAGIMDAISTVSGIGINPISNPTVASGAGSVTGAGTIVLNTAQTLENGVTLTFPGASTIVTISGYIKVNNVGNADVGLMFDLEKFLTMH
jgi:hypothetical protein